MDSNGIDLMTQNTALIKSAEAILSNALGKPVSFTSLIQLSEDGRRSTLYRCFTTNSSGPAGSFVIKKMVTSPESGEESNQRALRGFYHDWVGAEFLSSLHLDVPVSPRFFGADQSQGFLILEDLGEHRSLVEPLLQGDPASVEAGLIKYWTCLGAMHAATAGRAGEFKALFSERSGGLPPDDDDFDHLRERVKKAQEVMETLGVPFPGGLHEEINQVVDALSAPGPFLVFIHTDPCPDNVFDLGDRFRLIDFEFGRFGHALFDALHPRMIWPSCWCCNRLPEEMVMRVEDRYRAELVRGVPEAQEDAVWETALAHISGAKMLNMLSWMLERSLKEDPKWGISSVRQRIPAQIEAFINTSEKLNKLPELRGMASRLHTALQARWIEVPPMPLYPAFK